jgi:hypothetical protein
MLYQATLYTAVAIVVIISADMLVDGKQISDVSRYVLYRASMLFIGVIFYTFFVHFAGVFLPYASRLAKFASFASTLGELFRSISLNIYGLRDTLFVGHFFFPALAKWLLAALYFVALGFMIMRRKFLSFVLFIAAPGLALGASWVAFPAEKMMVDRIQFPLLFVQAAGFLVAWKYAERARPYIVTIGAVVGAVFVVQLNIWHMFLNLKNDADFDIASKIAERIRSDPNFDGKFTLVMVGTLVPDYLPQQIFPPDRKVVDNSALYSAFARPWSADRIMMFFIPFKQASIADQIAAKDIAKSMPVWPSLGSVKIVDGRMIVRLS